MSTFAEYTRKKKKKELESSDVAKRSSTFREYTEEVLGVEIAPIGSQVRTVTEVAPTVSVKEEEDKKWYQGWLKKSEGNFGQAIKASGVDLAEDTTTGAVGSGEKLLDALMAFAPAMNNLNKINSGKMLTAEDWKEHDKQKKVSEEFIKKDLYDEAEIAKKIITTPFEKRTGIDVESMSVFDKKADSLAQSGGQMGVTALVSLANPMLGTAMLGGTSFGSEMENALKEGATYDEAMVSSAITAGAEMLTEKISGGISLGGKTLDDLIPVDKLAQGISNKVVRNLINIGIDATGEGFEEIVSGILSAVGQKMTYMEEKELKELFSSEEALESFLGGAILGGISSTGKTTINTVKGKDSLSGLSKNEKAVFDKVYNDAIAEKESDGKKLTQKEKNEIYDDTLKKLEKGYIDIDTIEGVLGGETYNKLKAETENETKLKEEYDALNKMKIGEMTGEQTDRKAELKKQLDELKNKSKSADFRTQLDSEMLKAVKGTKLEESFNERSRKQQNLEVDVEAYKNESAKQTAQNFKDFGANNTNQAHDYLDLVTKVAEDRGHTFKFMTTKQLEESISNGNPYNIDVDANKVEAFVSKSTKEIIINMDANKSLNSLVGHEVMHTLEQANSYSDTQSVLFEYAKTKGEYDDRLASIKRRYSNLTEEQQLQELASDLVGDYVFGDTDFIRNLSTEKPNVFKKIYNEIKYLWKMATAGSKEARELERVKKEFEKIWQEAGNQSSEDATRYSLNIDIQKEVSDFGVENKMNDYIGVQKSVIPKLEEEGYFGEYVNEETEMVIEITKKGIKETLGSGKRFQFLPRDLKELKLATIRNLPQIINEAHLTEDNAKNIHGDSSEFAYFEVETDINGVPLRISLDVKKTSAKNKFWIHYIDITKENSQLLSSAKNQNINETESSLEDSITENSKKTSENGIRFSLKESVEETKDLIAVHNLNSSELSKTLELGGLPMPSIAVIKAQDGHEMYGDVTLILPKETIDPKADKSNKVYGGDAWTPTYPNIEYKPNAKVEKKISDKYYEFAKKHGYDEARPLFRYVHEIENELNREGGEASLLNKLYEDTNLMQMYLQDAGKEKVQPITKETVEKISDAEREMNQFMIDTLGVDLVESFKIPDGENPMQYRRTYMAEHEAEIRDAYAKLCEEVYGLTAEEVKNVLDKTETKNLMKIMRDAYLFTQNNGVTVKTETDHEATREAIRNSAKDGYKEWVDDLFKGVEEKTGIRNNADAFTRSGNRRSWDALHWENTLENVVKVMKQQDNGKALFGGVGIWGVSAKEYGSIEEIKSDSDRLRKMSEEDYAKVRESYQHRLSDIAGRIMSKTERNQFIAIDNAMEAIVDSVRVSKTAKGILKELKQYSSLTVTEKDASDIASLVKDISNMPTGYFEAKPKRAVGLDEVGVFVIPYDADAKLKQELLSKGYSIAEYDPNVEGDRKRVLNQFEQYKFRLADDKSYTSKEYGNHIYAKDVVLDGVLDIAPTTTDATVETMPIRSDYAPLTEEESNVRDDRQVEEHYFPDDVPTEAEEEYNGEYAEHMKPADPFYEKDIFEVGRDRKQKAYMYEHPEVKPFFQAEANYMLGELNNSTKGEKFYNDQLYYDTNGEMGWFGTTRFTSEDIAYLLDTFNYTYKDVEKGLKAIIEDNGKENNAISKRIEFLIDERLRTGYTEFMFGDKIPPNQDYINLLNSKEITQYNDESWNNWLRGLSDEEVATLSQTREEVAPPQEYMSAEPDIAPVKEEVADSIEENSDRIVGEDLTKKNADKIRTIQAEIKGHYLTRDIAKKEFDDKIAKKESEYESLKRKDTKKAVDLRNQITNLETRRDSLLQSLDNKIERANKRIESIERESRFEKRKTKQKQYRELFGSLMGDTSTWKDKKLGIQYQTNTLRRNLRDIVRDASGNQDIAKADALYNELQGSVNRNEAKKNREANKVKDAFREMKINNTESTYIQMLGELRHNPDTTLTQDVVDDYYNKNKGKIDTQKVDKAIEEARKLYDSLYDRVNASLSEHGFKEMGYRKGYFPHFTDPKQNWLAKLLNWKVNNDEIPTDIAGITETFEPQRTWQSFDKHRTSDTTDYNFLKGLDNYVNGALDWIYHIEDIQKHRAFETEIRYRHSSEEVQKKIDEYRNNPMLSTEEADTLIQNALREAQNPLNNFVTDLHTRTNILAGKKSSKDRNMESDFNRHAYSIMTNVTNRVTANQVVGSVSSALTNFIPITQSWGQVKPTSSLVGMKKTIQSYMSDDGVVAKSDFLTNRIAMNEALYKDAWDKIGDKVGGLMEVVDNFTSQTIWRSKYHENIKNGMTEEQAIQNADQFAENVIGGRSKGNMPTIFHAKNPVTKMLTSFQLEVANQYGYMFKDMPQDIGEKAIGKLVKGYATMFVGAYVYNTLYSSIVGRDVAFDPIGIIEDFIKDLVGDDDDEEKDVAGAVGNLASNIADEIPFVGGLLGGGRIPISSALPYNASIPDAYADVTEGDWKSVMDEMSKPLYYAVLPMGGGQIRKTVQGLSMFDEDHPVSGSYTKSGSLRFPVEDTFLNKLQAGVFGQYASKNAREYFDREQAPLKEKQIQEYIDVDLPISEYWDYREGLKGLTKLSDKADYINSLDLPIDKKNLLVNNQSDREEPIDLTGFNDDFENFEEFDFAVNNPEKYEVAEKVGGYKKYKRYQEGMKDMKLSEKADYIFDLNLTIEQKNALINGETDRKEPIDLTGHENYNSFEEFELAKENPKKYSASLVIGYDDYIGYMDEIGEIRADKDSNGKTINGSAKRKKTDYINSLNLDYGQRIILYRSLFDSESDKRMYNADIVEYLNNRDDISYEEMVTILESLDFKVYSDGTVKW